jgi:CO/xanthine dehydrogenase FAD-binding subunit
MTRALTPTNLPEALILLGEDPSLVPMAGCTDLMVADAVERSDLPGVLDLTRVPELRGVRQVEGALEIGATTTFSEIGRSAEVRDLFPALARASRVIGGWQIQNRATLGGNIANASPAGDSLPVLLVLDATVVAVSTNGERHIPYTGFHVGYRRTALEPGELIDRVLLPLPAPDSVQAFRKVGTREAQAISKVVVAMLGRVEGEKIVDYRLAAGSVAPTPVRLTEVEEAIKGRSADEATASLAGRLARAAVKPIDDVRSTATYRAFALERVVRRLTLQLI